MPGPGSVGSPSQNFTLTRQGLGSLFTEGETEVQRGGGQHGAQVTILGGARTWHEYHESLMTTVWWTQCDGHCDKTVCERPWVMDTTINTVKDRV